MPERAVLVAATILALVELAATGAYAAIRHDAGPGGTLLSAASNRDIAQATGAALSTVREWLTGLSVPSGADAERLAEFSLIVQRLARVIRPTYIPAWLHERAELLDDDKPIERIAAGDYRSVAR